MSQLIIADCLKGFHHPEGRPDICVPDGTAPIVATPVPAMNEWGLLILTILIFACVKKYL